MVPGIANNGGCIICLRLDHLSEPIQYDDFGNFNYGAAAAATGAPLWFALRKADEAHLKDHHGQAPNPNDHGDDWIKKGYEWYRNRMLASGCHAAGP